MYGSIHEVLILALAAQAGVSGDTTAMERVWPTGSVFPLNQWVRFEESSLLGRRVVADDPVAWMDLLVAEGTCSITVSSTIRQDMDRETWGPVRGGGTWSIHTSDGARTTTWTPEVTLDSAAPEDGRSTYRTAFIRSDKASPGVDADVESATVELTRAIERARDFALEKATPHWIDVAFAPALETIAGERDAASEHGQTELTVFVADPLVYRLLRAGEHASGIFGGMGSWNDGIGGTAESEDVTRALYLAVERAIVVAVNANDPGC